MSEDKMREEFESQHVAGLVWTSLRNSDGKYSDAAIEERWQGWKACAAIKEEEIAAKNAKIAELESNEIAYENIIGKKTYAEVAEEIAAQALMIKGLRGDLLAIAQSAYMPTALVGIIQQRLAKSEHHNSRTLEKMLLEAEIRVLDLAYMKCSPYGEEFGFMLTERKAKLAELNKE